jgi:hypothetical protein
MGRVAETGLQGSSFETNSPGVSIREARDSRLLLTEADAPGEQYKRGVEAQPAEIDR